MDEGDARREMHTRHGAGAHHEPGAGPATHSDATAHEHPALFFPERVLSPDGFEDVRTVLRTTHGERGLENHEVHLQVLEQQFATLDWLAMLARNSILGDSGAVEQFVGALNSMLAEAVAGEAEDECSDVQHDHHQHQDDDDSTVHDHHLDDLSRNHRAGAALQGPRPLFDIAPVVDVFLALPYAFHGAKSTVLRRAGELRRHTWQLTARAGVVKAWAREAAVPGGFDAAQTLGVLLRELASIPVGFPTHTKPLGGLEAFTIPWFSEHQLCMMEFLDAVSTAVGGSSNPVSQAIEHQLDLANSSRITGIVPDFACAGPPHTITVLSAASDPFDDPLPSSVVLAPCVEGRVRSRSATDLVVEIPPDATSGAVRFVEFVPEFHYQSAEEMLNRLAEIAGSCPTLGFNPQQTILGPITAGAVSICPNHTFPDKRNEVAIWHSPIVEWFTALDDKGQRVSGSVGACSRVSLQWSVSSDHPGGTTVLMRRSGESPLSGLAMNGSTQVVADKQQTYSLEATNGCGTTSKALAIRPLRTLTPAPRHVEIVRGQTMVVTLRSSCAVARDTIVQLTSTDPSRVSVPATATIQKGSDRTSVSVTGVAPGAPGGAGRPTLPAAEIRVSASEHEVPEAIPVWVERTSGEWRPSTELDMLAIHAALLRSGKVLFFSGDESDFNAIEKGQSRLWDPVTGQVTSPAGPLLRNLFCSGHSFLGDGRLLVAGGHAFSWVFAFGHGALVGRGADHDIHTFDPVTESWVRYRDMDHARWYPSCVTMPDGRVLILAGAERGAPGKPFYKGHPNNWLGAAINRRSEAFSTSNTHVVDNSHILPDWDFDLYPFLQLLPGGTLFVHSRRKTWLFYRGSASVTFGPLGGRTQSPITYLTRSANRRTYPTQGACVLLPLRPSDPDRVSILVVGGGDDTIGHSTHDTPATDTAEIFDFNPGLGSSTPQRGWRFVAPMSARRFMADAVLLHDGTVLVVGGAAQGIADDNQGAVKSAELFDPRTERWRTLASFRRESRYHSVALLLPDGRVVAAGGTGKWPPDPKGTPYSRQLEVFSPPYLFRGPRPLVHSYPSTLRYGQTFSVGVSYADGSAIDGAHEEDIGSAALVRASSTTHTNNMDQRYVELSIGLRAPNELTLSAPRDGTVAPPGYYLLVLINKRRVPSEGAFVKVGP